MISIKLFKAVTKVGNLSLSGCGSAVQSRPKSHTFTVNLAVFTPQPRWQSKTVEGSIDQRETTVGVFLDLSKAFDTLDHQILFTKLEHYGIRDVALRWTKSYFSCRRQFVQINQTCSPTQTIKCGVPQGSILAPYCSYYT